MLKTKTIGVLLMAYGSPDSLEELESYLLDIRGGRPVSADLLAEIRERYSLIGGRSPLLDLTLAQARALEAQLNQKRSGHGSVFRTYVGMRHWQPRIREALVQMEADGIRQAIALVMAPHSSRLSTQAYFARLEAAREELGSEIEFTRVESWHDHPGLIAALAEKVSASVHKFAGEELFVIFTAHSLPARILEQGDLYDEQLRQTAYLVAERLGLPGDRWGFCYQSAGQSAGAWLGPSIEEYILGRIDSGYQNLLVAPIGFVCDHVEVLYDIDIAARDLAAANGAQLERSESLNVSASFIRALADIVNRALPIQSGWS